MANEARTIKPKKVDEGGCTPLGVIMLLRKHGCPETRRLLEAVTVGDGFWTLSANKAILSARLSRN